MASRGRCPLETFFASVGTEWDARLRIEGGQVDETTGRVHERRVVATEDIGEGEEVACVRCERGCLGVRSFRRRGSDGSDDTDDAVERAAKRIEALSGKRCNGSWIPALSFALMYERYEGAKSKWCPYISALPQVDAPRLSAARAGGGGADGSEGNASARPWPLGLLAGTESLCLMSSFELAASFEYKNVILPVIGEELSSTLARPSGGDAATQEPLSYDAYVRARGEVVSRAFDVGGEDKVALVPMLDLFNHRTTAAAMERAQRRRDDRRWENDRELKRQRAHDDDSETGAADGDADHNDVCCYQGEHLVFSEKRASDGERMMTLRTKARVRKGVEVFNSYGKLGNGTLLAHYGFTLDNACTEAEKRRSIAGGRKGGRILNVYDFVSLDVATVVGAVTVDGQCLDARRRVQWCSGEGVEWQSTPARPLLTPTYHEDGFRIRWKIAKKEEEEEGETDVVAEEDEDRNCEGFPDSVKNADAMDAHDDGDVGVHISRTLLLVLLVLQMSPKEFEWCQRRCRGGFVEGELQEDVVLKLAMRGRDSKVPEGSEDGLLTNKTCSMLESCLARREAQYMEGRSSQSADNDSLQSDIEELDKFDGLPVPPDGSDSARRLHCLRVRVGERRLLAGVRQLIARFRACHPDNGAAVDEHSNGRDMCGDDGANTVAAAWDLF